MLFEFSGPVTSGTASMVDASAAFGTATPTFNGTNVVTVNLTGIPNNKRVTVSLSNVNGAGISAAASVGFLVGDVNNSRGVASNDILLVKGKSGQTTDITNFRFDLNANGGISSTDILLVKGSSGLSIP